ncbi:MAG: sulfotransferase family protein [Planctomycetia bacterium]|jgi:hypothetical protein
MISLKSSATSPALVITGMHRSGTSLATSLLSAAGVHVGDTLMGPGRGNPRGYFEDLEFVTLHEQMLAANGTSREGYTCQEALTVPGPLRAAAVALLARRRWSGRAWGWKDPRTTLFLDFWADLLPEAHFLFVIRPPWEVVDSLFRRGDDAFAINPQLAIDLWVAYNRRIRDFVRADPDRCLVVDTNHITADPADFVAQVGELLDTSFAQPEPVYDSGLLATSEPRGRRAIIETLHPEAAGLLADLHALAGTRTSRSAHGAPHPGVAEAALAEWARGIALAREISEKEQAERRVVERDRDRVEARFRAAEETAATVQRELKRRLQAALAEVEVARATLARQRRSLGERVAEECGRFVRRMSRRFSRAA